MSIKKPTNFLKQVHIQNQIRMIENKFDFNERRYFLVIKKCHYSLIHDIALKIDKLQKELQQPFEIPISIIKEVLVYYLPFAFLLCLNPKELKYAISELKKIDPDIFISIQNRDVSEFSIVLWNEKSELWKNVLDENKYLDFAQTYIDIVDTNEYSSREMTKDIIYNLSKKEPLVIFDKLNIGEIIVLTYHLQSEKKYELVLSVSDTLNIYGRKNFISIDENAKPY